MLATLLGEGAAAQKSEGTCRKPHSLSRAELALRLRGIPHSVPGLSAGGVYCSEPSLLVPHHHTALVRASFQGVHGVLILLHQ